MKKYIHGDRVLPYLGYTGAVLLNRVQLFGLPVLNRVYNFTCLCPKQGHQLTYDHLDKNAIVVSVLLPSVEIFKTRGANFESYCDNKEQYKTFLVS